MSEHREYSRNPELGLAAPTKVARLGGLVAAGLIRATFASYDLFSKIQDRRIATAAGTEMLETAARATAISEKCEELFLLHADKVIQVETGSDRKRVRLLQLHASGAITVAEQLTALTPAGLAAESGGIDSWLAHEQTGFTDPRHTATAYILTQCSPMWLGSNGFERTQTTVHVSSYDRTINGVTSVRYDDRLWDQLETAPGASLESACGSRSVLPAERLESYIRLADSLLENIQPASLRPEVL